MRTNTSFLRIIFSITAIPLFFMLTGCFHNYYQTKFIDNNTLRQNVETGQYGNRYFILRNGNNAYNMTNLMFSDDKNTLYCHLDSVSSSHNLFLMNEGTGKNRYKSNSAQAPVLKEVHLYIAADSAAHLNKDFAFSLAKVQKIEMLEKDKGKTTASYIIGGLGSLVGAVLTATAIAIALDGSVTQPTYPTPSNSSCPYISAYNGTQMQLQGEIYGGAIYPQLCRNDYIGLQIQPNTAGKLQVQISNELKEIQYTDLAELLVVSHKKNVQIVADENGNLHSISNPMPPAKAIVNNQNVMPLINNEKDNLSFNFDDTAAEKEKNNELMLSFNNPDFTEHSKLILRLKNSYWLDLVYGKFTQGFGSYYTKFIQKQQNAPVEKLNNWKNEQQLPLTISLLTNHGWQVQQRLTTFGPLAARTKAIPIDLSDIKNGSINIKLTTGFMFWEIDYAALDFSDDAAIEITKLLPEKATDENGKDVKLLINKTDGVFMAQPVPGNAALIEYAYNPLPDTSKTQTYILHAKGYYEHLRDYKTKMDVNFLQQFKHAGALSKYSMTLYQQAMNNNLNVMAKK